MCRPKYDSPGGDWVGVTARVNVLVYNTNLLQPDQVPTSILDLAQPQWKNKIAIAPSETDFQPIVTSVLRTYGSGHDAEVARGVAAERRRVAVP